MSNLSLRLPDSLHRKVRELAEEDDVSINQFIATAVAEKAAALLTMQYLEERGRRADPKLVAAIMSRVPDVPPGANDERPEPGRRSGARSPSPARARPRQRGKPRTRKGPA